MYREEMLERLRKGEDALELSIQKWKDIVKGLEGISEYGEFDRELQKGRNNCALCAIYAKHYSPEDDCIGCPVKTTIDRVYCRCTPFAEFAKEQGEFCVNVGRLKAIAKREVEFLEGLRNAVH